MGRIPPLCYSVSTIKDTLPLGITKFVMSQSTFNPNHDNAELMLCDYYGSEITPSVSTDEPVQLDTFDITYNGTKASVKVGGSEKVFTAQLVENNDCDVVWSVSDGTNTYENTYGDYAIKTDGNVMKLKIASNYKLIGTVLTIRAQCTNGSYGEIQVEVI